MDNYGLWEVQGSKTGVRPDPCSWDTGGVLNHKTKQQQNIIALYRVLRAAQSALYVTAWQTSITHHLDISGKNSAML